MAAIAKSPVELYMDELEKITRSGFTWRKILSIEKF